MSRDFGRAMIDDLDAQKFVSNFSLLSRKKEPFTNLYLLKALVLIGQLSQRGGKKEDFT